MVLGDCVLELINNVDKVFKDELSNEIKEGSKLSIAAACFSMYAYQELKDELQKIDRLRFIFTEPTFTTEKAPKEKREFYIPRLNRELSVYGTEFEIKLKNELTQKAIAKECADWVREKVTFKSNVSNEKMGGFVNVDKTSYYPIHGFTTVDLGCDRGNNAFTMITKNVAPNSEEFLNLFEELWNDKDKLQDVTDEVLDSISTAYAENSPEFIYYVTLYNIFNEFLDDISEDVLPNDATGFKDSAIWNMLYNFQKDAALAIINKLEKYNGCILADSVGLGKTFTALSVIKYYENKNKSVLVLCPKKLSDNWNTYKDNYKNNPIASDRLNYDVLYHTDLSREHGYSNGLDLSRINWGNYDLVVIDESHNFRNGAQLSGEENEKENRYLKLLNQIVRQGVKTKVLMLSATPVNNRFNDLKNQLALAYEGNSELLDSKLNTKRTIDDIFRNAQTAFNNWSKRPASERTTENLLKELDFDFFEILDSVTIARSRKHIQKYYDVTDIGTFPKRLPPKSLRPHLTDLENAVTYNDIIELLNKLTLCVYLPSHYILASKEEKYEELHKDKRGTGLSQLGRENGIRRLMAINLLKRLESSVYSFDLTINRIRTTIDLTIKLLQQYSKVSSGIIEATDISMPDTMSEWDLDDQSEDFFHVGKKVKIDIADLDYVSWIRDLSYDLEIFDTLLDKVSDITPEHDSKLQMLYKEIDNKLANPINPGNKKIIIFTAFADTADYLYENVHTYVSNYYGLNTALITGGVDGRSTIKELRCDLNTVLTCFSPMSKDKALLMPNDDRELDILIATDCISEGQNLQDCDYLINYDIHWNPVRIIQRFGRIDRIGSKNDVIQLVNFWPDVTLDDYINLKAKVETRMKIVNMTATGDENLLSEDDKTDLEYRKAQLKRLQEEVVDIEDMSSGISIMDLGLNEFRLDLLEYAKENDEIDKTPLGLHAVAEASKDVPSGVMFVLKNRSDSVNIDKQNRLHPFYMVYLTDDGEVYRDHLSPKDMLDTMRYICKGNDKPISDICREFNKETNDGKNMKKYSELLEKSIASIIEVKERVDIDSLFRPGGTTLLSGNFNGLDDFELVTFLVIR